MRNTKSTSQITINTDGGSRGNPGPAAWAFVVKEEGNVVHEENGYMGVSTNNRAEYTGVLMAFRWLKGKVGKVVKVEKVVFILDSELVARQLSGVYKIKDTALMEIVMEIKKMEQELDMQVTYTSVPRAQNRQADALVNKALDENVPVSHHG